ATDVKHPLLEAHEKIKNSLLLVLTSNRGLCGGYNTSILREAIERARQLKSDNQTLHVELSGKRAIAYCRFQGLKADKSFTHFDEVEELADRYIADYIAGKLDRVEVAYMKFLNAARQTPVVETLLPLSSAKVETRRPGAPQAAEKKVEYEFLPDAKGILEEIL